MRQFQIYPSKNAKFHICPKPKFVFTMLLKNIWKNTWIDEASAELRSRGNVIAIAINILSSLVANVGYMLTIFKAKSTKYYDRRYENLLKHSNV